MSDRLRQIIREMLEKELEEIATTLEADELDETSTTGGVAGFMTPKAFVKTDGDDDESLTVRKKLGLDEGRGLYHDVRDAQGSPAAKIGRAFTDVNRKLHEIDRLLEVYSRIKTENDIDYTGLWKRTVRHIGLMERKLLSIARHLKELKS
jgi:hypothetical protein